MEVAKVTSVNNQSFGTNTKVEQKETKTPEQIKDGKKKLVLALGGLAVASATTFALYKTGKLNGIIDSLKQLKNKNKLDGFKNKDSIGNTIKPDLSKPKVDTVIGDTSLINKTSIQEEAVARIEAQAKANEAAQQAQEKFNKPFEDKLANKSAKESAEVFIEEHNTQIKKEALARTKQENSVKAAQEFQDAQIEKMQNPSGMSKAEKQELVNSLEDNLNKKELIQKKPDVQQVSNVKKSSVTTGSTQAEKQVKRNTKTKRTYNYKDKKSGFEEIVEIKGKGDLKDSESFDLVHCEWKGSGNEPELIDAVKSPLPDWQAFDNISYTQGNERYTMGLGADDKKLKIKQPNGKFKTIKRETPDKIVSHLEDGTTHVLDKNNNVVYVYDNKGNIIDEYYNAERKVVQMVGVAPYGRGYQETIYDPREPRDLSVSPIELPMDRKTLTQWIIDSVCNAMKKGELSARS